MSPDNPRLQESPTDSWPVKHQQMARDYVEHMKDIPGVVKIVGATTNVNFLFLGAFIDYQAVSDETLANIENDLTKKYDEIRVLFMPFDARDAGRSNLMEVLDGTPEYQAPAILFDREKEAVPA